MSTPVTLSSGAAVALAIHYGVSVVRTAKHMCMFRIFVPSSEVYRVKL
jgi:hypothetical protein